MPEPGPEPSAVKLKSGVTPTPESGEAALTRLCPTCQGRYPGDFKVCPHDATPLEEASSDDEDPLLGQRLAGTYDLARVIGEGGMGRVYEARHSRLSQKRFAIKVLHHDLVRQTEVVARFRREAEVVSSLDHPNLVKVFDFASTADGRPFIVAELLEGTPLGAYLEEHGKPALAEAVRITRQVCQALALAHENGVVHRDIKPDNIFLVGNVAKVLDFGISKLAEGGPTLTKTGTVMGTPDYMPPEQARGDIVDARADVYAVGAILYHLATGHKPFEGLDPMTTLRALLSQNPRRPTSLEPSLPVEIELVIQRAMARDAAERYQTIAELDEALAAFESRAIKGPEQEQDQDHDELQKVEPAPVSALADDSARAARLARPGLVIFTVMGSVWLLGNVIVVVAALIRLLRKAELTDVESVLTFAGALGAIVTPGVAWIRHLAREVWPSTPRAIDTARRIQRALLVSASAYGMGTLFVHLLETVVNREGANVARPAWALVVVQIALIAGVVAWTTGGGRRAR